MAWHSVEREHSRSIPRRQLLRRLPHHVRFLRSWRQPQTCRVGCRGRQSREYLNSSTGERCCIRPMLYMRGGPSRFPCNAAMVRRVLWHCANLRTSHAHPCKDQSAALEPTRQAGLLTCCRRIGGKTCQRLGVERDHLAPSGPLPPGSPSHPTNRPSYMSEVRYY